MAPSKGRINSLIITWGFGEPPANSGGLAPANAADLDAPPDIFTAFEQQLGLKLQSTKAVVDVMVIDRIERPSPN